MKRNYLFSIVYDIEINNGNDLENEIISCMTSLSPILRNLLESVESLNERINDDTIGKARAVQILIKQEKMINQLQQMFNGFFITKEPLINLKNNNNDGKNESTAPLKKMMPLINLFAD